MGLAVFIFVSYGSAKREVSGLRPASPYFARDDKNSRYISSKRYISWDRPGQMSPVPPNGYT